MQGIYKFFLRFGKYLVSLPFFKKIYSQQIQEQLKLLNPTEDKGELTEKYYIEKISLILMVFSLGCLVCLAVFFVGNMQEPLSEGNHISRGDYGTDPMEVSLQVAAAGEEASNITYEINGRYYTPDEIAVFEEQFTEECDRLILGENSNLDNIKKDLRLTASYEGYPMDFQWKSEDFTLLDSEGEVHNESLTAPRILTLTVIMTYGEREKEYSFPIKICPRDYSPQEKWEMSIKSAIEKADLAQKYTTDLILPTRIQGKEISYILKNDQNPIIYIVFLLLVCILLFFGKDNDLNREIEKRKQEMTLVYPEFISKFIILLGTGMPIRNVFFRLSEDDSLGNYLHRELQLLVRDFHNGVLETEALDRFGKRSRNPLYIKFCALIIQNLKKGNRDLLSMLKAEAQEALLLRKNHAKQLGEEVGTKLLVPMIIMLGVVMVLIIVPALLSFQL